MRCIVHETVGVHMCTRDKKIAEIDRFFREISDFGGAGKDFGVEKSDGKKSRKNWDKSVIFRRFFGKGPIFVDFSGRAVHARRRRVRADIIFDKSAINSKYQRFFGVFRHFFGDFSLILLALGYFSVFDLTVQISSAFFEKSKGYIFDQTVDFKSEA